MVLIRLGYSKQVIALSTGVMIVFMAEDINQLMLKKLALLAIVISMVAFAQNPITADSTFQVRYAANLNVADSLVNITNTGANGASLTGPGFGPVGNLCVNVYAFSPDEQLVSCCSCLITPNGLVSLSVYDSLRSNTLTGVTPNSMVIKLVATGAGAAFTGTACTGSAAAAGTAAFPLAVGMAAWGTTAHVPGANAVPAAPAPFAITETAFTPATLSAGELASINNRCTNIIGNGSGFGICRGCSAGGRGGARQ